MTLWNQRETACVVCGGKFMRTLGPGQVPLTCSPECQRVRKNRTAALWRANHEVPPDKHGTLYAYATLGCGCEECRSFWAGYRQSRRLANKEGSDHG